ncbi:hypothetical protein K1719_003276 [Acacia pycnantha]|nr:hypothetical protein K1719_003276 [Acacia pycnantha]
MEKGQVLASTKGRGKIIRQTKRDLQARNTKEKRGTKVRKRKGNNKKTKGEAERLERKREVKTSTSANLKIVT